MRAGAVSVLDKPASPQDLWDALYGALRRDERERARRSQQRDAQRRLDRLSVKERQVLQLLLDGLPNKVIARRLDVSVRTVEARRSQLFKKTGTRSVAELVRFVLFHTLRAEPASAERNAALVQPRAVAGGDGRGKASAGTGGGGVRAGGDGNGQASTSPFRGTPRPVVGSPWQIPQIPERSPDLGGSSLGGPCRVQFVD